MSKRLKDDKVKATVNLDVTQPEQAIHEYTKSIKHLREQNQALNKDIAALVRTEGDHSKEIKRLDDQIRSNKNSIQDFTNKIKEQEKTLNLDTMSASELSKRLRELKRQLANTSRAADSTNYKKLSKEIDQTEKALAKATRSSKGLFASFMSLDKITETIRGFFLSLAMVVGGAIVGQFKKLTAVVTDFERANSKLAAILGTNKDGVEQLTEQAKLLGRTTTATAAEVTGLQTELAKLGFTQKQIEDMTPAVLGFAKAVDTDLSSAAAFAGATLRIFGKDSSETEHVMATLAIATTKSALDFGKLENSMSTIGPIANAMGFSLEDTTALLGVLANSGFDAGAAATATRNILLNLCDASGDLAQALGGPVKNSQELVDGLKTLEQKGVDLAKVLELTDKRSVAAFSSFMKNADTINELREAISGCDESYKAMKATMVDNAAGAWKGLESAIEGLVLKFSGIVDVLHSFYNVCGEAITWLGKVIEAFAPLGTAIMGIVKVIELLFYGIGKLIGMFTSWLGRCKPIVAILNVLVAALVAFKLATLASSQAVKTFILSLKAKTVATIADLRATQSLSAAMSVLWKTIKANVIGIVAAGLAAVAMLTYSLLKSTKELTKVQKAKNEADQEAASLYGAQKAKVDALILVAQNENVALENRKSAVESLNKIIPGYNAQIDETTGKYKASSEALKEYLGNLEKEMRYKANEKKLQELITAAEEAKEAERQTRKSETEKIAKSHTAADFISKSRGLSPTILPMGPDPNAMLTLDYAREISKSTSKIKEATETAKKAEEAVAEFKQSIEEALQSGEVVAPGTGDNITDEVVNPLSGVEQAGAKAVARLKEIEAELKSLRKQKPKSDNELQQIQNRIKALQAEKQAILGNVKTKHEVGTYREGSMDAATASVDQEHQQRLLDINRQKDNVSEAETIIAKNKELIRYSQELKAALNDLAEKTDKTHTQTLDKIAKRQGELDLQIQEAQQAVNGAMLKSDKQGHQDRIAALKAFYGEQETAMKRAVVEDASQQEAADIYLLGRRRELHQDELNEYQNYLATIEKADYISKDEKQKLIQEVSEKIRTAQNNVLADAVSTSEKLRELTENSTTEEGITKSYDLQLAKVRATYDAMINVVGAGTKEAADLEAEKQRRIEDLNFRYKEQLFQLQEITGVSWAQEYERELSQLERYHRLGMAKEKDYQRAKLQLQMNNTKKYFDYYSALSGSMFSAVQDAEIADSDAKYDALIQQAKNNGEDTAKLEEEKENRKLEIQKKYADVNFAIKVSQIIADTAVSIMKAFADLGPIGGAIAAAMLTATGLAQAAAAKAERDKIKSMQPSNTSGSSTTQPAAAERVLSGYSEGGYTGNGGRYEVAGVVHRGEYVVPMPIMSNPRVVDAVGTIEAIRRNKVATSGSEVATFGQEVATLRGYAAGGLVEGNKRGEFSELTKAVSDLKDAASNIRAYVVLQDIEKTSAMAERARQPFTRKR